MTIIIVVIITFIVAMHLCTALCYRKMNKWKFYLVHELSHPLHSLVYTHTLTLTKFCRHSHGSFVVGLQVYAFLIGNRKPLKQAANKT